MRFFKLVALTSSFFISLSSLAGKKDSNGANELDIRPGSRSVYVANHDPEKKIDSLRLKLRKCDCTEEPTDLRINGIRVCDCWNNILPSDQPAIQGDLARALVHKQICGKFFPGVQLEQDPKTLETVLVIPSPESLVRSLQVTGMESFVQIVSGSEATNAASFLKLLSEGKIPVGAIPNLNQVTDPSLLYHFYFHDLVNHVWLWTTFPDQLRALVALRAKKLLEVSDAILRELNQDTAAADFVQLFQFYAVAEFDSGMGSLNNFIFDIPKPFEAITEILPPDQKLKLNRFAKKRLEQILNFGPRTSSRHDPQYALTVLDQNLFMKDWILSASSQIETDLIHFKHRGITHYEGDTALQKDPQTLAATHRLMALPLKKVASLSENIVVITSRTLNIPIKKEATFTDRAVELEAFYHEVKNKTLTALEQYNKGCKRSRDPLE